MNTLDRYVIAQDCSKCGATYGEPCRAIRGDRKGLPVGRMHIERYYAHWSAWTRMHTSEELAAAHWERSERES